MLVVILMRYALVLLLLVAACGPSFVCPDGSVVAKEADCPQPAVTPQRPPPIVDTQPVDTQPAPAEPTAPAAPPAEEAVEPEYGEELAELLGRHEERLRSVEFLYAPILMKNTGATVTTSHEYHKRGDRARVIVADTPGVTAETRVDTVFLDLAAESARGFCLDGRSYICAEEGRELPVEFAEYDAKFPSEWLAEVPGDAEITSEQMLESRTAMVVEFERDGEYYRYYIDSYMGVPMQVHIFADAERRSLSGGIEYHDIAFNSVQAEDVALPE